MRHSQVVVVAFFLSMVVVDMCFVDPSHHFQPLLIRPSSFSSIAPPVQPVCSPLLLLYSSSSKEIYGVEKSGWKSSSWNWGYGVGTGHDCAAICRRLYRNRQSREELINNLLNPSPDERRIPDNFEEVKLILALAWQRGRWDGSDGGIGGYGDVLEIMAQAQRYEDDDDDDDDDNVLNGSRCLVVDMQSRFHLLKPTPENEADMQNLLIDSAAAASADDVDLARRRCSGLVLQAMGFVEGGL